MSHHDQSAPTKTERREGGVFSQAFKYASTSPSLQSLVDDTYLQSPVDDTCLQSPVDDTYLQSPVDDTSCS